AALSTDEAISGRGAVFYGGPDAAILAAVCANIGEAWRKRRYKAHFVSKLSDAESEASETRVWLEFALHCGYLNKVQFDELDDTYDKVIAQLVRMLSAPEQWTIR